MFKVRLEAHLMWEDPKGRDGLAFCQLHKWVHLPFAPTTGLRIQATEHPRPPPIDGHFIVTLDFVTFNPFDGTFSADLEPANGEILPRQRAMVFREWYLDAGFEEDPPDDPEARRRRFKVVRTVKPERPEP